MDALVIGAGHAGLATSRCLRQLGVRHLVLERDRVGASWANQRWDSFTLNTPTWMNRLPGDRDEDLGQPGDGFAGNRAFVARLGHYVERWNLPVRTGVNVTSVEPVATGGYRVHVEGALPGPITCAAVVVASGIQNVPRIPSFAADLPEGIDQMPALDYRAADRLAEGAVLVVGAGQTGGQLVEDLLGAGRTVYWSVSKVTRIPRRYRGRDILEWLVGAGFYEATVDSVTDPRELTASIPIISGVGRYGHTLSLQWLAGKGAQLLGRITDVDGVVLTFDDSVAECIGFADQRSEGVRAQIDESIRAAGLPMLPLEPDPADEPAPDPASVRWPTTLDLIAAGVSTIIFATGVRGDFGYLPAAAVTREGAPAHDHGRSALPGLLFIGLPWLTRRGSGIIHGIGPDAEAIAQQVKAQVVA